MKKILLVLLALSTLLLSNQMLDDKQKQIADTKAQILALQASLEKLESSLPENIEKEKSTKLAAEEKKKEFIIHGGLGFSDTGGNTDTTAGSIELNIKKSFDKHLFELSFDGQYSDDENVETKNKYFVELEYDYEFTDRFAFDYLTGYKDDKFSGYDYQFYTGPGVKYKVLMLQNHDLSLETNILYSKDSIEDKDYDINDVLIKYPNPKKVVVAYSVSGDTRDYTGLRAKFNYEWRILETLKFQQEASWRAEASDTKNYFVFSKTALINKIDDVFSFSIDYKIDYINEQAPDKDKTDTTLTASIIIDY